MPHSSIPIPKGQRLLGHLAEFKKNPLDCMIRWHREFGDIVNFRILSQNFYLLAF